MRSPELRQLIINLAALHPDDAEAVLSALEPDERQSVKALLGEFSPFEQEAPVPEKTMDRMRISRWLAKRLDKNPRIAMSEPARLALNACAVRLYPTRARPSRRGRAERRT